MASLLSVLRYQGPDSHDGWGGSQTNRPACWEQNGTGYRPFPEIRVGQDDRFSFYKNLFSLYYAAALADGASSKLRDEEVTRVLRERRPDALLGMRFFPKLLGHVRIGDRRRGTHRIPRAQP